MDAGIEGLAILAAAFTGGMRVVYGVDAWRGEERPFWQVWGRKSMYFGTGVWLLLLGTAWFTAILAGFTTVGRSQAVRMADLLALYGLLTVIDLKQKIVPDRILICYLIGQLLMTLGIAPMSLVHLPVVLGIGCLILVVLMGFSRLTGGRIGMGDAKLLGVTAMTAGAMYTMQIACVGLFLSFLFSIGCLLFRRLSVKTELPFVPFLAAGMVVHLIYYFG